MVQPGHIVSDAPGVIGCFGSYIRHPHPGDPAGGDQAPTCPGSAVRHVSPLFNQSHREAFSAASKMFLVALRLDSPQIPKSPRTRCRDWPAKPLQPTSTGSQWAFHPFLRHSATKSAYLALFLSRASSIRSSQGTVSLSSTTCLLAVDTDYVWSE